MSLDDGQRHPEPDRRQDERSQQRAIAQRMPTVIEDIGDQKFESRSRPRELLTMSDLLSIFSRRRWLLLAIILTFVVLTTLNVMTTTPLYRSTAVLEVEPRPERVLPFSETQPIAQGEYREFLNTQVEKLQSGQVAGRAFAALGEEDRESLLRPSSRGVFVDALAQARKLVTGAGASDPSLEWDQACSGGGCDFSVAPIRSTRLIEVSFTSATPELSAKLANTLVESYILEDLEARFNSTSRTTDFLETKLSELQTGVEQSEEELLRYAREQDIVSISDRETIALRQLQDFSSALTEVEGELIERRATANALGSSATPLPDELRSPLARQLEARLSTTRGELAGIESRLGPDWPEVKKLKSETADLENQIASEDSRTRQSIQAAYRLAEARHTELKKKVEEARLLLDELNERSIRYDILRRENDTNEELYEGLLERLKQAGVAAGLQTTNARIVNAAPIPRRKHSPKRSRLIAFSGILGLGLGIGLVLVMEAFDTKVRSPDEVHRLLDLPILGKVPTFGGAASRTPRLFGKGDAVTTPAIAFSESGNDAARAREAYHSVRTSLQHSRQQPHVLLVSSALPVEGKTTTALNLAVAFSQAGGKTILVDLDLRRPSLAPAFNHPTAPGMGEVLSAKSEIGELIRATDHPDLYFLAAGRAEESPPQLLSSNRLKETIEMLRDQFDYVILDTPPMLEISDALTISKLSDGVVLVIRSGITPLRAPNQAVDLFHQIGVQTFGVVMNEAAPAALNQSYYGATEALPEAHELGAG